jgi:acyl-CoA reductase-like NAD-dependent aldehyde dehydrogenase
VQRVYVQRDRFDEFTGALAAEVAKLRTGDPLDEATDVGAMVDEEAAERVVRWTAEAAADGADVVLGGTRDGATMDPTLVANPPATASIVAREVFGALVAVLPYDTFPEVIETCNASRYGLQAGLFTRDIDRIITAWRELQVGGLVVGGSSNFRLDHIPFGGVKDSGFGRESPRWMIDDYTVVKTLMLRGVSPFGQEDA